MIATKVTSVLNFTGGTLVAGAVQNLFFVNSTGTSGAHAIMEYQFMYLCQTGIGTVLSPFADDTSGTQQKYTPNYNNDRITVCGTVGACGFSPPVPSCSINALETADVLPYVSGGSTVGALITYTALFTNNSAFGTSIQRIRDDLPNNVTYGSILPGSDVQPANSLSVPSFGASGSVTYTGILPNTSYKLSPNSTLALVYTATLTGGAGRYTDTVSSIIGTTTCGSASVPIQINSPTAVTLEKLQASETHGILAWQYQDIAYLAIVLSGVLAVCVGLARRRRTL